jgi:hypothetical protein
MLPARPAQAGTVSPKENRGPSAAAEKRAALVAAAKEVFGSEGFDAPLSPRLTSTDFGCVK